MAKRKTFSVAELKARVNRMLTESKPEMVESRVTAACLLETVLHETGNYLGFRYLPSELSPNGTQLRRGADESRREYY